MVVLQIAAVLLIRKLKVFIPLIAHGALAFAFPFFRLVFDCLPIVI